MHTFADEWYQIRDEVFDGPALPQEKVNEKFVLLDEVIWKQMALLIYHSDFVEDQLAEIFRYVTVGQNRTSIIFSTPKTKKSIGCFRTDEIEELESFAELYRYVALGDKDKFFNLLRNLKLVRFTFEDITIAYLQYAHEYQMQARCFIRTHEDESMTLAHERAVAKMQQIESMLKTERNTISGVFLQLQHLQGEYQRIRNEILVPYLRVVYAVAKKNAVTQVQFFDNFQNGTIGLHYAISGYSLDRKTAFSVYCNWWIRQQILHIMKSDLNLIRIPMSLWETYSYINKTKKTADIDSSPTLLAQETGLTEDKIKTTIEHVKIAQTLSLHHYLDDDSQEGEFQEILIDYKYEDSCTLERRYHEIQQWLTKLSPDEYKTYILAHGFLDLLPEQDINVQSIQDEKIRQLLAGCYLKLK